MSITSLLEIQVDPARLAEVPEILGTVLADTRAFDGCESVLVIQDQAEPTRFIAVETWASLEHDTAYRAWRAGDGASAELAGLLVAPPRLTVACERDDI